MPWAVMFGRGVFSVWEHEKDARRESDAIPLGTTVEPYDEKVA